MKKYSVPGFLLCLLFSAMANGQITTAEARENLALFPATGVWWTPPFGEGRWGVQIEVQQGNAFADGLFTAAVFSYDSDDIQSQAWYVVNQTYEFNPAWRNDGFIARMQLTLQRTTEGTCLECADGAQSGAEAPSEVTDVEITFFDSATAELIVGDVVHPLVKAQFGDGLGNNNEGFWTRPFQLQIEASSAPVIADAGERLVYLDIVEPVFDRANETYNEIEGWDVYQFTASGSHTRLSVAGAQITPVETTFEIFVNPTINEYHLVYGEQDIFVDMQLFTTGRHVIEGRTVESASPNQSVYRIISQSLMVSTPSMRGVSGEVLPYPIEVPEDNTSGSDN